jgi:hypothetical protein
MRDYVKETHSFNVMFEKNEKNMQVFEEFKEFCEETTNNNYLQGIKNLLFTNKALCLVLEREKDERFERRDRE